jgi:hypothetical protein
MSSKERFPTLFRKSVPGTGSQWFPSGSHSVPKALFAEPVPRFPPSERGTGNHLPIRNQEEGSADPPLLDSDGGPELKFSPQRRKPTGPTRMATATHARHARLREEMCATSAPVVSSNRTDHLYGCPRLRPRFHERETVGQSLEVPPDVAVFGPAYAHPSACALPATENRAFPLSANSPCASIAVDAAGLSGNQASTSGSGSRLSGHATEPASSAVSKSWDTSTTAPLPRRGHGAMRALLRQRGRHAPVAAQSCGGVLRIGPRVPVRRQAIEAAGIAGGLVARPLAVRGIRAMLTSTASSPGGRPLVAFGAFGAVLGGAS